MAKILTVALSLLPGLQTRERALLEDCVPSPRAFESLHRSDVEEIVRRRIPERSAYEAHGFYLEQAAQILRSLEQAGAYAVGYWEKSYPPQLREAGNPPYVLYVRGSLPNYDTPMIAIVGTRRPTPEARGAAFALSAEFSLLDIPVVSGLAYGIDAAAHWGAVKTRKTTFAVLGTGIDQIYPAAHRELAHSILRNRGALLSEKPPYSRIGKYDFPRRNRIIAGLSRGVVVVQAPEKSGALITAEWANEYGRSVYVHNKGLQGAFGEGGRRLAEDGAQRIDSAEMVLQDWGKNVAGPHMERLEVADWNGADLVEEELSDQLYRFEGNYYRRVG